MILHSLFAPSFTLARNQEIRIRLKSSEDDWSEGRIDLVSTDGRYLVITLFRPVSGCYGRIAGEIPVYLERIDSRRRTAIAVVNRDEYEIRELEE